MDTPLQASYAATNIDHMILYDGDSPITYLRDVFVEPWDLGSVCQVTHSGSRGSVWDVTFPLDTVTRDATKAAAGRRD